MINEKNIEEEMEKCGTPKLENMRAARLALEEKIKKIPSDNELKAKFSEILTQIDTALYALEEQVKVEEAQEKKDPPKESSKEAV